MCTHVRTNLSNEGMPFATMHVRSSFHIKIGTHMRAHMRVHTNFYYIWDVLHAHALHMRVSCT